MYSSFWLLRVVSRDLSQAEKERTACKAEKILKMATIFTQKRQPRAIFSEKSCHVGNLLSLPSYYFFLSLR
jgi:hypothetical protein